ncbi:hypothetical protein [Rhodobacter capsulatus]|uniref:hypothetical protein n=1 Tax=Rhodobacter capsulatus TaxID=1061 RepID=UPI0003D2AB02|nr:hypothetical protein [Rhodobacter capsulatus]ETD83409.1 hypothetical protein U716_08795 [Rhodobacter capsulatus B6]
MKRIILTAACAAALFSHAAMAGELTGASIGLDYNTLMNDDNGRLDKKTLSGSAEYGIDPNFSLQGDLAYAKVRSLEADGYEATVHGIYHANDTASFGVFAGRSDSNELGLGLNYTGLEAGLEFGAFESDIYLASGTQNDMNATLLGLGTTYNASEAASVGLSYDRAEVVTLDASRVQLEGEYRIGQYAVTAQVGHAKFEDAYSDNYIGVGAKMTFGAKRGATFDRRGIIEAWPGL